MKYFLPTYEQAKEMVTSKGDLVFYETVNYIDGFKISVFNYRLAQYMDFVEPVVGKNYKAHELRGLTYVFNADGSLFNRYLLFNKFFNLNQVTESMYDMVKNKKINSVYNKDDGSLVTFIKLPNGKIIAKTKVGLDNEQVDSVNNLLNKNISDFVNECLEKDLVTMWEYVSFKNKIVLDYKDSNLILLKVRNLKTGEYVDVEEFRGRGFDVVRKINQFTDLDSIISWSETAKDVEGVVVTFEDEFMVKIKTQWYCDRHHLLTEDANREDYIIRMVLEETIDDIRGQLEPESDKERLMWIDEIEVIVKDFMKERIAEVDELITKFDGNIKDFAIRYKKDKNFAVAMNVIRGRVDSYTAVKDWLLNNTKRLEQARSFIDRKGFKRK
jgi:T4 RnlA family RNA ligase